MLYPKYSDGKLPLLTALRGVWEVPRKGLEPLCLAAPDPKPDPNF